MIFQFLEINIKKKYISIIMKKMEIFLEQKKKNFDGLLPILWTGHAGAQAGAGRAAGAQAGALAWALGRWAGVRGALGWRAWGARQGRGALGKGARQGRADGRGARGRVSRARGRGRRARQARH